MRHRYAEARYKLGHTNIRPYGWVYEKIIKNPSTDAIRTLYNIRNAVPSTLRSILTISYLLTKGIEAHHPLYASLFGIRDGKLHPVIRGRGGCVIRPRCIIRGELTMEEDVLIDSECKIEGEVSIGRGTDIMFRSELIGPVKIGRYCAIARNSVFQGTSHFTKRASMQTRLYSELLGERLPHVSKGGIEIGNDVWIGTRAIVLPGVHIGDGAVIGAGSIVTKDVEPYSVSVGVPAKHKYYRFNEKTRSELLKIKWWEWDKEKIKRNKRFFMANLDEVDDISSIIE